MTPRFYPRIPTNNLGTWPPVQAEQEEPTDEELGWWDEDDIPVNIYGEENE